LIFQPIDFLENLGKDSMNRRKKVSQTLIARAKRAKAKLAPKTKEKYISKADRVDLAEEPTQDTSAT